MTRTPYHGGTLPDRILRLRQALGSVTRPLSYEDFARILSERAGRGAKPWQASTVHRWENGAEPPLAAIEVMSQLAGVPYVVFALGRDEVANPAKGAAKPPAISPQAFTPAADVAKAGKGKRKRA